MLFSDFINEKINSVPTPSVLTTFMFSPCACIISLVIESRFAEHVDIPKSELEPYEVPQQTFFIGDFPKSNDKAAIRAELIRLLKESNENN